MKFKKPSHMPIDDSKEIQKEEAIKRGSKQAIYFRTRTIKDPEKMDKNTRTKQYPVFSITDPTRYELDTNDET